MEEDGKHYQARFMTLEEAMEDARAQSERLGTKLYVVSNRRLFYADSNGKTRDGETLHACFGKGKAVEARGNG